MNPPLGYRRENPGAHPPYDSPAYASTHKRAPHQAPVRLEHTLSEITGPCIAREVLAAANSENDLTHCNGGEALGERIIVTGRVIDEDGRAIPHSVIEIWQANAAGRYSHAEDRHDAPLDPHFAGIGRVVTDEHGAYRFMTVKPGAYPWRNHHNAWRPNHIHLSLFGPSFATRLVTQMYFPGDPLLALDPIYNSVPDHSARERLIATFDIEVTIPEYALGYRFDFVLRGRDSTPAQN
ncbi:MAG: protocatechuate 3,4-dioxygenase subunit beta [Candidatus Binatus sp.]|uniref:protocatechuate 3,4-dioxygenase subunit beta n=1 Tax=Candidatus Binatus sp. TaxID=2811406 RepID=UPI003C7214FD